MPSITSASIRVSGSPKAMVSRSLRVRLERPLSARQMASSTLVLPAPFGPHSRVTPSPRSSRPAARLRKPSVWSAATRIDCEPQTLSRIGITR